MTKRYASLLFGLLATAGSSALAQITVTRSNFIGVVVPQYMSSNDANARFPFIYRARLTGLTPNATYRFFTRGLSATDIGATTTTGNGAGNPLFLNGPSDATLYTTAPKLKAGASGSFTTDASGEYTGWFSFVNTGNARFTAGNTVTPGIIINAGGGAADSAVAAEYALDLDVTVLKPGTANGDATGIFGSSLAAAKHIVALYDNGTATGRPLSAAVVESIGTTINTMPAWYGNSVVGQAGRWGTFVPNNLASGVRNITLYDWATGDVTANNTSADGMWGTANTVNPTGGSNTPIEISSAAAPLSGLTAAKPNLASSLSVAYRADRQQLELLSHQTTSLRVVSLTGQMMGRIAVNRNQTTAMSTQGWAKGMYIIVDERANRTTRTVVR